MEKLLSLISKHHVKITAATIIIPLIIQLKTIIFLPVLTLYEKLPSYNKIYDSVLSIRYPFGAPKKSNIDNLTDNIANIYYQKNYNSKSVDNLISTIKYLLHLQIDKNSKATLKKNIDNAISEIAKFNLEPTENIITKKLESENDKNEVTKLLLHFAALKYFSDKQEALKYYYKALDIEPNNIFAWNNIGNLLHEFNRKDQAIDAYTKLSIIAKRKKRYDVQAIAFSNLGVIHYKDDNYPLAFKYYSDALNINKKYRKNPAIASQYINIAILYEKQNHQDKACNYYRMARITYIKNYQDKLAEKLDQKLLELKCH